MLVIKKVLGNYKKDLNWKEKLCGIEVDSLVLDQREAQKNSCRKITQSGQEIGISLNRNVMLTDGDVLLFDAEKKQAVVVQITLREVMVLDLKHQLIQQPEILMRLSFELGHALGNQHWNAVIRDLKVFIPLSVSHKMMLSVLRSHELEDLPYSFVAGETILPYLSCSDSRLLFGGAEDSNTHIEITPPKVHHGDGHEHH